MDNTNNNQDLGTDSLESPVTAPESNANPSSPSSPVATPAANQPSPQSPQKQLIRKVLSVLRRFNIYLLLFGLILILAVGIGWIYYLQAKDAALNSAINSQSLSATTLDQLGTSDVTVGEPKHTLSVQSNAVFTGDVLVRNNLQIAGSLQVGSNLALNGIKVSGSSTFDDVQITKSLSLAGDGSIQGQLNVQKGLSVNGGGSFQGSVSVGSLTTGSLQMSGDLTLIHHIAAGGSTPGRTNGTALGSGGTASVSGSDTAGSITVNTGSSPAAGCFITVNFATKFNTTPHVIVTPVGSAAAGLGYYINRSTSSFSVCSTNAAPSSATFGFDYIAFD